MDSAITRDVIHYVPPLRKAPVMYPGGMIAKAIIHEAATAAGLSEEQLISGGRKSRYFYPRACAMYACVTYGGLSIAETGRIFGRDHTTVMNAIDAFKRFADKDVLWSVKEIARLAGVNVGKEHD